MDSPHLYPHLREHLFRVTLPAGASGVGGTGSPGGWVAFFFLLALLRPISRGSSRPEFRPDENFKRIGDPSSWGRNSDGGSTILMSLLMLTEEGLSTFPRTPACKGSTLFTCWLSLR